MAVYWLEPSNATVMAELALLVVADEGNVRDTLGATAVNKELVIVEF